MDIANTTFLLNLHSDIFLVCEIKSSLRNSKDKNINNTLKTISTVTKNRVVCIFDKHRFF